MKTVANSAQSTAQANRLKVFASFFKGYMGVMPLVTAAFAPLLTLGKALPIFDQQSKSFATFLGLLGFLVVAWTFSARHTIARIMFFDRGVKVAADSGSTSHDPRLPASGRVAAAYLMTLPFLLIVGSVMCFFSYNSVLDQSVEQLQLQQIARTGHWDISKISKSNDVLAITPEKDLPKRSEILKQMDYPIPNGMSLASLYFGIFLFAELAFVIMATREYVQDVLRLSDREIIDGRDGPRPPKLATKTPAHSSVLEANAE